MNGDIIAPSKPPPLAWNPTPLAPKQVTKNDWGEFDPLKQIAALKSGWMDCILLECGQNCQSWIKWIKTRRCVECSADDGMMWALPYLRGKSAFGRSRKTGIIVRASCSIIILDAMFKNCAHCRLSLALRLEDDGFSWTRPVTSLP